MGAALKKKAGKARRQPGRRKAEAPVTLPQGDTGPDTPAQHYSAEVIPLHQRGGDWHWKNRRHALEWLAKPNGPRRTARITPREKDAGLDLWKLHEMLNASGEPAWCRPYVDSSPTGGAAMKLLERQEEFDALNRLVPRHCRAIVNHVVIRSLLFEHFDCRPENRGIWLDRLREALNILADARGY